MFANAFERHYNFHTRLEAENKYVEAMQFIEKASRLASIGVMAAGINHEINQPLTAIKFNVDGLLYWEKNNKGFIPEIIIEGLQDISDGVRRIDEIIKHMRSYWAPPKQTINEIFDLNEAVKNALYLLNRQIYSHGIEPKIVLEDSILSVFGNRIQVEQIVINLLANAINALDEIKRKDKRIEVCTHRESDSILLSVCDNGPGISVDDEEKLFDPFFSTKKPEDGTGLGLAIVKYFVDRYRGSISVANNDSSGVTFTVRFPVSQQIEENSDENSSG